MKILNLVYANESDISYKISQFPDGQQDVSVGTINGKKVNIYSRMNSFRDLELIICTVAALRRKGINKIELYIPYLLGARSDRQFGIGTTSYLVDVVAPILNSLKLKQIKVVDVHSDVAPACIKNLFLYSNESLFSWTKYMIYGNKAPVAEYVLVSPDGGSLKKIYNLGKNEVVVASKHRDIATGQIDSTEVSIPEHLAGRDFIIVDDICDGGRTFIELAKKVKPLIKGKLYLVVTHGVFSKGLGELSEYFDHIYCTNSYSDIKHPKLTQHQIFK